MNIEKKILEFKESNLGYVLAIVVKKNGSVPGKVGFKMIVDSEGDAYGTVGGGAIEERAKKDAEELLASGESNLREYILSDKKKAEKSESNVIPMKCNGKVTLFYEVNKTADTIYIFGGGHVGNSLLKVLSGLPFSKVLIDNRAEYANETANPNANEIIHADYLQYAKEFEPRPNSYFVILTHGHKFDYDILKELLKKEQPIKYVGVIASKSKAGDMMEQLKTDLEGNYDESIIHSPIGLDIGGSSPGEIALAITAEIQAVKYEKPIIKNNMGILK